MPFGIVDIYVAPANIVLDRAPITSRGGDILGVRTPGQNLLVTSCRHGTCNLLQCCCNDFGPCVHSPYLLYFDTFHSMTARASGV